MEQTRHRDCNVNVGAEASKRAAGKAVPRGRWTPRPEFMKLRLAEDERWPGGGRKRPRCADHDGEALRLIERTEMSGSEFERENIVTDALSAAPASKPAEPAREHSWRPPAEGLSDPPLEKDPCGVGFIANIKGKKSHQIVSDALNILCNLEHRGAVGADPRAGDGAGILVQIPHAFFARKTKELGFTLPRPGEYAVGALFMPKEKAWRKVIQSIIADQIKDEHLTLLGWRDVPSDNFSLGETVKPTEPAHMQVFIGRGAHIENDEQFERRLYILRKSISQAIYQRRDRGLAGYYPVSMSCRTVVYKGMFLADQLGKYYPDLHEPDFESALALVHQLFSTNTIPPW